jgi:methylated-DNA-[protein]-cysteine S-methyltransferase
MFKYAVINTKLGWLGMVCSEKGLILLTLPQKSRSAALSQLKYFIDVGIEDVTAFRDLSYRLQRYFDGEQVLFYDRLDTRGATAFQRAVWSMARAIPYGETRSYAWVAGSIGRPNAVRAVGGALARNRIPIIVPCHRVVSSDGGLGGFSGGLELKKRLLELESAH